MSRIFLENTYKRKWKNFCATEEVGSEVIMLVDRIKLKKIKYEMED